MFFHSLDRDEANPDRYASDCSRKDRCAKLAWLAGGGIHPFQIERSAKTNRSSSFIPIFVAERQDTLNRIAFHKNSS